jgi:hypothetical protein
VSASLARGWWLLLWRSLDCIVLLGGGKAAGKDPIPSASLDM